MIFKSSRLNRIRDISWTAPVYFASIAGIIVFAILGDVLPVILFSLVTIAMFVLASTKVNARESKHSIEVLELKKVLEKRERIISDFSHKIRTPLNNFSIIIELINSTGTDEYQKELLETLIASTSNMVTAVNDLTVSSAQDLSFETRKSINFNLTSTLQNTVELFDLKSDSHLSINISPEGDIPDTLRGDPIAVKQIFLDLLNEVDTGEPDRLEIDIRFSVNITGKDSYKADFNLSTSKPVRYIRQYPETTMSYGSLAVKLIKLLGGGIPVPEKETTSLKFWIMLEKAADEIKMSDAALRIRELKSEKKESKLLSEANILLVEDNPANQKIVLISLARSVKNIDTAVSGKEALDLFGKSNYDLILMDVQLPVMDGITAVKKIRELEASTSKHTPVIAITANAMLGDKEKCLSAGMDEYLSKPFHPDKLLQLIEKHITG